MHEIDVTAFSEAQIFRKKIAYVLQRCQQVEI